MPRSPGPHHRFARRVASAATVVLLMTVTLLAQWHESTTIHVRCAAHGELTHASHSTDAEPSRAPLGGDEIAARTDDATPEHEHCGLIGATHAIVSTRVGPITISDGSALVVVRAVTPLEQIAGATFRLAPKTSPPV